jgi:hypothetical protein
MGQLVTTMSSIAFLKDIINPAREAAGENPVRNNDFIARIEDELDDLPAYELFVSYGKESKRYQLNVDQMLLVGMRESKSVRRSVLAKLKAFEASFTTPSVDSLTFLTKVCETDVYTREEKREMIRKAAKDYGCEKYLPEAPSRLPSTHTKAASKKPRAHSVAHGLTFEQAIQEFVANMSGTGAMPTEDAYLLFCEMYGTNMARRNKFVAAVRVAGADKRPMRFDGISRQGFKFH